MFPYFCILLFQIHKSFQFHKSLTWFVLSYMFHFTMKTTHKKYTTRCKKQFIYDVPTIVQYIFIGVYEICFTLLYNLHTTMIFMALYNQKTTVFIAIKGPFY